jgi:hypothetical protein
MFNYSNSDHTDQQPAHHEQEDGKQSTAVEPQANDKPATPPDISDEAAGAKLFGASTVEGLAKELMGDKWGMPVAMPDGSFASPEAAQDDARVFASTVNDLGGTAADIALLQRVAREPANPQAEAQDVVRALGPQWRDRIEMAREYAVHHGIDGWLNQTGLANRAPIVLRLVELAHSAAASGRWSRARK